MLAQKTKERLRSNTLINVVETLEGHVTDIDLVNDKTIRGTVESVDLFMNVTMKDATVTAVDGSIERVDAYFIPSASIRYIHFPKDFNIIEQATQREQKLLYAKNVYSRNKRV